MSVDKRWLVENRSRIQEGLLKLDELPEDIKSLPVTASVFNMLVGVGFSLWRAVFLIREDRDPNKETSDAAKFLDRLIETNTIGFGQDRKSAHWSAGYYINNAAFRLHALTEFQMVRHALTEETAQFIRSHLKPEAINVRYGGDLTGAWEEVFEGFDRALRDMQIVGGLIT